jgi:hypothetical protein
MCSWEAASIQLQWIFGPWDAFSQKWLMEGRTRSRFGLSKIVEGTLNSKLIIPVAYHRPLVAGTSESDQLDKIFRLLGTPTMQDYPGIVDLPEYSADLPPYPAPMGGLSSLVSGLDSEGIDLLGKMHWNILSSTT